ncbi:hypothetical protein GCM10010397_22280 [Streptomyces spinoverrucosus]|nr:hypothetical protein GCM10010397_22280 [Streptomyces spinoverrucosus]
MPVGARAIRTVDRPASRCEPARHCPEHGCEDNDNDRGATLTDARELSPPYFLGIGGHNTAQAVVRPIQGREGPRT